MELGRHVDSTAVRRRRELGLHQWGITVRYFVTDPTAAIIRIEDRMVAAVDREVKCLQCSIRFDRGRLHQTCPFAPDSVISSAPSSPDASA